MIQNVKEYVEQYTIFSEPIPYKDLELYPIMVKDYLVFDSCVDILQIEKNKIPDIKVIQMSYLKFLILKLFKDDSPSMINELTNGELYEYKFVKLLSLIFHVEENEVIFGQYGNGLVGIKIKDVEISHQEFDEIRKIILFQNIYDYDDIEMSDDFKRVVSEYYQEKNKNIISPTLEDKIDVIITKTSLNEEQIKNMSYRRFCRIFDRVRDEIDYIVGSNGYTRKEPPEHWIYRQKKEKYGEVFAGSESLNQLQNV